MILYHKTLFYYSMDYCSYLYLVTRGTCRTLQQSYLLPPWQFPLLYHLYIQLYCLVELLRIATVPLASAPAVIQLAWSFDSISLTAQNDDVISQKASWFNTSALDSSISLCAWSCQLKKNCRTIILSKCTWSPVPWGIIMTL